MTAIADDTLPAERRTRRWRIDWVLVSIVVASLLYLAVVALAVPAMLRWPYSLPPGIAPPLGYAGLAIAATIPVWASWRRAVSNAQLPASSGAEPTYEHIDGWGALFLFAAIGGVAWLVWWATTRNSPDISGPSGTGVVQGVAVAFLLVATAPMLAKLARRLGAEQIAAAVLPKLSGPVSAIGKHLSGIDSFFVFAIAPAVGVSQRNVVLRYAGLFSALGASVALGFYWPAPWSFIPIAWGFVIAFSISRRWAWIEDDRDLAMLNPTLQQAYIRVGFDLNLRDEALIALMSMFLLVPLALMQGQRVANHHNVELFVQTDSSGNHHDFHPDPSLDQWVSFYGTELAKALPFVDWAEVYDVHGGSDIGTCPDDPPLAPERARACNHFGQHAIFATRVLIDLVFLSTLLQAIGIATRDAQQRELFYKKRAIRRLDPFSEPEALRGLVRRGADGNWERNGERFDDFPEYDYNRLVELQASPDSRVRVAVGFLLLRDGAEADPQSLISVKAANNATTEGELHALLIEVEQIRPEKRNVFLLALTRTRLRERPAMANIRRDLVRLIIDTPHSFDRNEALIAALVGTTREPMKPARELAFDELAKDVGINDRIRMAIQQVARTDAAPTLRQRAKNLLDAHPEKPD